MHQCPLLQANSPWSFNRKITAFLIALCVFISTGFSAYAFAVTPPTSYPDITAKSAVLQNPATGEIIFEKDSETPRVPASMTKLMTAYIVLKAVQNGQISLDTVVPISAEVEKSSKSTYYTNVPLSQEGTYTVDQLLKAVMIVSACSATTALAELVAGTEADFTALMNKQVSDWGLRATFYDASGIADNSASARVMAEISRHLITEFPVILNYTREASLNWNGKDYKASNQMLYKYPYQGLDGLKTGYTSASGHCFVGTASRNNLRLLTVVMGATSQENRFSDTRKMLDYGFQRIEYMKEQPAYVEKTQIKFNEKTLAAVGHRPFKVEASFENVPNEFVCNAKWFVDGVPVADQENEFLVVNKTSKAVLKYTPVWDGLDADREITVKLQLSSWDGSAIISEEETVLLFSPAYYAYAD